jgi:hypothetical protein
VPSIPPLIHPYHSQKLRARINRSPHTDFVEEHPGGAKILKRVAGKDASKQFWKYHNDGVLKKYGAKLKVGSVAEKPKL